MTRNEQCDEPNARDERELSFEYLAFLRKELVNCYEQVEGQGTHIHPSPEWINLYQNIIQNADSVESIGDEKLVISFDDILMMADSIARFSSYKAQLGQPYQSSQTCDCFTLTKTDMDKLREGVV